MPCWKCGSQEGDAGRLCPKCIAENQQKRAQSVEAILEESQLLGGSSTSAD
ncbi:MAG: hypothetical protein KDD70_09115 [Bdellovibrionales bacterium]|nr:hypothetical protein [Bdellovibrionales bacterium]